MFDRSKCFIITPIGDEADPIRRHIEGIIEAAIKPALSKKYELTVAHKISEPGSITKQVITEIYSSKLAIANLTNRNPNVMYELAFRHSLGKPVIMIAEKGTPLPSDIIMERTIFYQNDAQGVLDLIESIKDAENKIDFSKESSPIYDIIQEFNRDAQIVKISEEQFPDPVGNENANILRHILQKLNNLEDNIQSMRLTTPTLNDIGFPAKRAFVFKYASISRPYQEDKLLKRLQKVSYIDSDITIAGIDIEEQKKFIVIYAVLVNKIGIPEVFNFFLKAFSEYGFTGVEIVRQDKM